MLGLAWKSLPSPGRRLLSAKEPQGEMKSTRPMRTSRRRMRAKISRLNWVKLSPARRRSGPGAGIKRKISVGSMMIAPRSDTAGRRGMWRRIETVTKLYARTQLIFGATRIATIHRNPPTLPAQLSRT
jgi:hypothetical protein